MSDDNTNTIIKGSVYFHFFELPSDLEGIRPDYNGRLISFVEEFWNHYEAMHNSPSLERTIKAVENFQPEWDRRYDV